MGIVDTERCAEMIRVLNLASDVKMAPILVPHMEANAERRRNVSLIVVTQMVTTVKRDATSTITVKKKMKNVWMIVTNLMDTNVMVS